MEVEALVRIGKDRGRCEDRCLIGSSILCDVDGRRMLEAPYIVAAADGVGGNILGDMAAGYVLEQLAEADAGICASREDVINLILRINNELIELAGGIAGAHNMATTLAGIIVNQHGRWLFNAGNTRVYSIARAHIRRLTNDHTTYAWLMAAGRTDEARICNRSEITCCLGNGNPAQLAQLEVAPLEDFSALMLTSDGVHEALSDEQMESILNRADTPEAACHMLCDAAQLLGSRDDMTVAIIC